MYSKIVQDKILEMTGYDTGLLDMCERTNATFTECPVSYVADAVGKYGSFSMGVAIHNPSNIEMKKAEILVPAGTYRAIGYNISSGLM